MKHSRELFGLGIGLLGLLVAGCNVLPSPQADPTRYYVLGGPAEAVPAVSSGDGAKLRVGLHTIDVATYLRSPEMVVRSGGNEVELKDYARWAEPLQAGITRILRTELAAAPKVARVDVQPFPLDATRNLEVTVSVLRCEGGAGGGEGRTARFEALVTITTGNSPTQLLARKTFAAPNAAWNGSDYGQLAALLTDDVVALGKDIAATIDALPEP